MGHRPERDRKHTRGGDLEKLTSVVHGVIGEREHPAPGHEAVGVVEEVGAFAGSGSTACGRVEPVRRDRR